MTIRDIQIKYGKKIASLDLELLIADAVKKSREFVLAHPEFSLNSLKIKNFAPYARRALSLYFRPKRVLWLQF